MSTGEIYRRRAKACLREAEKMHDPAERFVMLGIARIYMSLAQHVERRLGGQNDSQTADEKSPGPE